MNSSQGVGDKIYILHIFRFDSVKKKCVVHSIQFYHLSVSLVVRMIIDNRDDANEEENDSSFDTFSKQRLILTTILLSCMMRVFFSIRKEKKATTKRMKIKKNILHNLVRHISKSVIVKVCIVPLKQGIYESTVH